MRSLLLALFVSVLGLPSCASAEPSASRSQFIVAHDHGWLELRIEDPDVAAVLDASDPANPAWSRPSCSLSVLLDDEPFLREPLYPHGARAPYSVQSGFRFPVSTGEHEFTLNYMGCGLEAGAESLRISETVDISAGYVLPLRFTGRSLVVGEPYENTIATLDSIQDKVDALQPDDG